MGNISSHSILVFDPFINRFDCNMMSYFGLYTRNKACFGFSKTLCMLCKMKFGDKSKQMRAAHVWKIVSTITLWILWKYRCKRLYDSISPLLSDILPELWGSLLVVVRGQYDNMSSSSEIVLKKRKKLLQLWRKLPLFIVSSQG